MGLASIGVWTLGRQAIIDYGGTSLLAAIVWTVIGIAGVGGALAGPAVNRLGLTHSWISAMATMAAAGILFALLAAQPVAATTAAAAFGAAYIALTGILLVWATRLFPDRPSFGVGISFLFIALGQTVGAPLAGAGVDFLTLPGVLIACAVVAGTGALLAPRRV
jgi:predicted MFS family arabinose efflux permease